TAASGGAAACAGARSQPPAGLQPDPQPTRPLWPLQSSCLRSCPAPDAQARGADAGRSAGSAVHPRDSNAGSKNIPYRVTTCVLARIVLPMLRLRLAPSAHVHPLSSLVRTIIGIFCHDLCSCRTLFLALSALFPYIASPQINRLTRPDIPPKNFVD